VERVVVKRKLTLDQATLARALNSAGLEWPRYAVENWPRTQSLRWYLAANSLGFNDTIRRVNDLHSLGLHA
jgi:hypothetical protein